MSTEQEMREAFEGWAVKQTDEHNLPYFIMRTAGGEYFDSSTNDAWKAWQAATLTAEARIRDLEAMLLVVDCCETIQRMQTHSDKPKDYWQVKMKGITDPYWRARDDIKPLLKSIHEDLFSDAALTKHKENQG